MIALIIVMSFIGIVGSVWFFIANPATLLTLSVTALVFAVSLTAFAHRNELRVGIEKRYSKKYIKRRL